MKTGRQATDTATITHRSKFMTAGAIVSPLELTRPAAPRQPRMLNVLLPIALPTAMSRSPRSAASTEVATSGSDVPAAMIVRPMIRSLTPSARANATELLTSHSEPSTSRPRPAAISSSCTDQWRSQAARRGMDSSYSCCVRRVSARAWRTRNTM